MSKKVIGIDLGTGNSVVSVIENGKPVVVANSEGRRTTPSVVSLKEGERKVGEPANRQRVVYPKQTVFNIKRFMGSDYNKSKQIADRVPYEVVDKGGMPRIKVDGREYSPEEISSYILNKMKKTAEDYVGETVTDAVITCPAWFDSAAREATKLAGEMCGLNVLRIINEPTAAILASGFCDAGKDMTVMTCDLGQGTCDFSVCEISDGLVEVKASKGDVFLGGADFDNAIVDYVVAEFAKQNPDAESLRNDPQAMQRIIEAAEKAKIELSSSATTELNLPYIMAANGTPKHLAVTLTRAKFEQLTSHLIDRVIQCGQEALNEAKVDTKDLDCILLVGGQTRSLALQDALTKRFNVTLNKSVNPDEAVALGAAIQANIIVGGHGSDVLLLDVTPLTLGIETMGGVMTPIVEANTTIPCKRSQIFSTAEDNQPAVSLRVLQGERPMAADNKLLGQFNLEGILPAPKGTPQIEVTFEVDINGIISVSAIDKVTNKQQNITIENKTSLSQEEIDRVKREAEEHKEEDEKAKARIDLANKAEHTAYQARTLVENMKDNPTLTAEDKDWLTSKADELDKMRTDSDYDNAVSVVQEVEKKMMEIGTKAYAASNPNAAGANNQDPMGMFNQMFGGAQNPNPSPNSNPTTDEEIV